MSAERIEAAKRSTERAKARLESTLGALQRRLHPKVLANDAWDGVREKSNDLADGAVQAVRKRPAAVSAALGAFVLFLAREPLKRAVTRMVSGEEEEREDGLVVTRIDKRDRSYETSGSPLETPVKEGVS